MNSRSKQLRADQRRGEIVVSAQGAIRRLGLRRAGMREIARAAGLSAGNLYYYFRNKQELVYYCQDRTLDALRAVATHAAAEPTSRRALAVLIEGHLRVLLDPATAGAVHLDFEDLPKPLYRKLVDKRDQYEGAVRTLIEEGQRVGDIEIGDSKLQAFALLGALNWAARWYRPDGSSSPEEIAEVFVPQLLIGILSKKGKAR
jgi:AcrR family transcriptional regulator